MKKHYPVSQSWHAKFIIDEYIDEVTHAFKPEYKPDEKRSWEPENNPRSPDNNDSHVDYHKFWNWTESEIS